MSTDDFEQIKKMAKKKKLAMSKVAYHWIMSGLQMEKKLGDDNTPYSLLSLEDITIQSPSTLPANQLEAILFRLLELSSTSCHFGKHILENTLKNDEDSSSIIEESTKKAINFVEKFKEEIR